MDDFRTLDDFSDSTDDPFGSPLGRFDRRVVRQPTASAAQAGHRVVAVLLALGIGGGSLALFLSILVINLLPVVVISLVLLLASAVIAIRFRRSAPELTTTRLIWRVCPTVGMLYGIALGFSFASGNAQLDTVTVVVLAGIGALGGVICAAGAFVATRATTYATRHQSRRLAVAPKLAAITVGSLVGGAVMTIWISSTGHTLLPASIAFGPAVTVLLVGVLLLRTWRVSLRHSEAAD